MWLIARLDCVARAGADQVSGRACGGELESLGFLLESLARLGCVTGQSGKDPLSADKVPSGAAAPEHAVLRTVVYHIWLCRLAKNVANV